MTHPTAYCPKCHRGRVIARASSLGPRVPFKGNGHIEWLDLEPYRARMASVTFTCGHTSQVILTLDNLRLAQEE